MKRTKYGSVTVLGMHFLTITQTEQQEKDRTCTVTGYEEKRGWRGQFPTEMRAEPGVEYIPIIKNHTLKELLVFDVKHKIPNHMLTVDNPAALEDYGVEGTDHELDPN